MIVYFLSCWLNQIGTRRLLSKIFCNIFLALPMAQQTRGLRSSCQSQIAISNTNLGRISSSEFWLSINKTSASPLNLKFKILTQPSFRISTKIQLHNLYKTSATKCWTSSSFKILLNFKFKILTNPCAQSLNKSLALWQKPNLQKTVANTILIINITSNSNNLNKFWVVIFTCQGQINKVY